MVSGLRNGRSSGVQELQNGSADFRLLDGCELLPFALDSSRESLFCRRRSLSPATPASLEILRAFTLARFSGLILNTTHRDAFDHQFLRKEEDQYYRQHGHAHGGHNH